MLRRILLDPQGGEGNGTAAETKAEAPAGDKGADLVKAVEALISRHGDPTAALRVLMGENYSYRDQLREAKSKLPAEGSVVLAGDDVAAWKELTQLGRPAEIRAGLDTGKAAAAKVAGYERRDLISEAAGAIPTLPGGFNAKVLATLAGPDLVIEVRDGTHLGKAVRVAEVVTLEKDAKGAEVEKRTPLDKFAEKAWPEFLPSLRGQKPAGAAGSPPVAAGQPRPAIQETTFRRSLVK